MAADVFAFFRKRGFVVAADKQVFQRGVTAAADVGNGLIYMGIGRTVGKHGITGKGEAGFFGIGYGFFRAHVAKFFQVIVVDGADVDRHGGVQRHDVVQNMLRFVHIIQRNYNHFCAVQAGSLQYFAAFGVAERHRLTCAAGDLYALYVKVEGVVGDVFLRQNTAYGLTAAPEADNQHVVGFVHGFHQHTVQIQRFHVPV